MFHRLLPRVSWIGELRQPSVLRADILAGITVAMVLVPQSMAYAKLAGLPLHVGLYAAVLPPIIAILWGSSRQLATGPTAMISLMTCSVLLPFAHLGGEAVMGIALVLALLAGVFQMLLGLCRLGLITDFISHPVMLGVTNAAAIVIATSQLGSILNLSVPASEHHFQTVWRVLAAAGQGFSWWALGMTVFALAIMVICRRIDGRIPGVLLAVIAATAVSALTGYDAHARVVGDIPGGLPGFTLPPVAFATINELLGPAMLLSCIGIIEAVAISKVMALQTRHRFDVDRQLVGQGLANIAAAGTGGYPVSGSFSRSAVNLAAGAVTGFSGVVTALVVVVVLTCCTGLLYHLPHAALAAVIVMAVANLVRIAPIRHAWKVARPDALVAIATCVVTLVVAPHLDTGIIVGVLLSLGAYLATTMRPVVALLARHPDGSMRDAARHGLPVNGRILWFRFDGRLFFANTSHFEDRLIAALAEHPDCRAVILVGHGINAIDSTGETVLSATIDRLERQGVRVVFWGLRHRLRRILDQTGLVARLGADRFVAREEDAAALAERLAAARA
jgi:sulfate permease, SulP family